MTSKEAIQELQILLYNPDIDVRIISKENQLLDIIRKDLIALEILKKYMWFSFHKELGFQVFCNDTIDLGNEEEFNLLKEGLENGKQR